MKGLKRDDERNHQEKGVPGERATRSRKTGQEKKRETKTVRLKFGGEGEV